MSIFRDVFRDQMGDVFSDIFGSGETPVVKTYSTLSSINKSANLDLSNEDLTATATNTAWKSVLGTIGLTEGLFYFTTAIPNSDTVAVILGVGNSSTDLGANCGADANSWGWQARDGRKFHSGSGTNTDIKGNVDGDEAVVAVNFDTGKIWFGRVRAGVRTWCDGGDPVAGTGEQYSGLSGTLYIVKSIFENGGEATLNAGQETFVPAAPSGFNSGFYSTG